MMGAVSAVDCPTCPAKAGEKCRTLTTGRSTDTHRLRWDRYHEWAVRYWEKNAEGRI